MPNQVIIGELSFNCQTTGNSRNVKEASASVWTGEVLRPERKYYKNRQYNVSDWPTELQWIGKYWWPSPQTVFTFTEVNVLKMY